MAVMDVDLEIHAPGLDLHHQRWNYHVLFMDEVHKNVSRIAAYGWKCHLEHGRGTIFVDREKWMTVIRDRWNHDEILFPCSYVASGTESPDSIFSKLRSGFKQLVDEYNAENQFVLTVEHHSADLLSSYLMSSDPGPRAAYQELVESGS